MRTKKGFSVIELMVVLMLLGVVVVLSLRVGESVTANSRITGLINNFLADFSQAKLLASSENRFVAITFSADGRSYTLQKQADINNFDDWILVKQVTPFNDRPFFNSGAVSDFAVNSTGEVRLFPLPAPPNPLGTPSGLTLSFFIRKGQGGAGEAVAYNRTIQIFPYGGLKVEKQ